MLEDNEKRVSQDLEQLERREGDLAVRENMVLTAEPFLQVARQLQDMGLDINSVIPWLETISEKAQIERTNIDVAAISVAQEIRNYRINGGLHRQIEIAQGQLKMLDITCAQKEKALSNLAELQKRGISTDVATYGLSKILDLENKGVTMEEIHALSKIIDLKKMSREWNPLNPGSSANYGQKVSMGRGNGGSGCNNSDLEYINRIIEMGQPKEKTTPPGN